jgi:hypothetical protein
VTVQSKTYFKVEINLTSYGHLHSVDHTNSLLFQLQVRATKAISGQMQTAFATVNITVTRNENAPVFSRTIYEVTIPETSVLGSNVVQLTATDQDSLVSKKYSQSYFFFSAIISIAYIMIELSIQILMFWVFFSPSLWRK